MYPVMRGSLLIDFLFGDTKMAVMQETQYQIFEQQAQKHTTLANYFEDFARIYREIGPKDTLSQLMQKCHKTNEEIRFLRQGISFFEDILLKNEQEMPEIAQFKARLQQAAREQKALALAINCMNE